jgi:ankyrin repeat protein
VGTRDVADGGDDPHWHIGSIDAFRFDELYAAIDKGPDTRIVEYLEGGGDPNLRRHEYGWTLLHAAAFKGRRGLVEALVAAGADVDALQGHGFTPLASAAHKGQIGCVRALLAAGASPACRPLGQSLTQSLQYAAVKSEAVLKVLLATTRSTDTPQ